MLSDKIKKLRQSRGLTQEELALDLFVSRSMIAKYETGKAYPTSEFLQKIADYFGVSVEELSQRDELIDEHSKMLEQSAIKKQRLVVAVAVIGVLALCIVAVLSVIEVDSTEYLVDYARLEWDEDFACWNLIYYEESNPDILQRRARLHVTEFVERKILFTIDGEDWFVQFNKYNVSEDYRELKSATFYYQVSIKKSLLGIVNEKSFTLEKVDFHLQ